MNRYPHRHTASESKTTVQPLVVWKVYALPEEECLDEEINTTTSFSRDHAFMAETRVDW